MKPNSVIATGASSQIVRFLLSRLIAAEYRVIVVSRKSGIDKRHGDVHWQQGDITAGNAFIWPRGDVLIHIAPLHLLPAILPGFLAQGGLRVICFGTASRHSKAVSASFYGRAFAATQIASEQAVTSVCSATGAHWTLFHPTLIYGYVLDRNITLIASLIRRFGFLPLLGKAKGQRQPVHADDLAAACVSALDAPQTYGRAHDLAGNEALSYRQMVERIFGALNRTMRAIPVPMAVFRVALWLSSCIPKFRDLNVEMARRLSEDLVFNSSAAIRDLGYSPRPFQSTFLMPASDVL